jgi:lysozyme family protein
MSPSLQALVLCRDPATHTPSSTVPYSLPLVQAIGSNLVWFNVLNATSSLILSGTYGFSASMVGLSYVSALIGVAVGAAYTGWIGDWFVIRKARKNAGIMEPEHRLWLFMPSLLTTLAPLPLSL